MLRLRVLLVVAVVALGVVIVPGTDALPTVEPHASAAQLPALRSAPVATPVLARPVGRSSAVVHGTRRAAGFHAMDVGDPPPATTAVSPDDGATVTTSTPTLSVAAVAGAGSYRFKVTTKADAETGTIVADTAVPSTSFPVPDGALKDGVTYYWHAYAADAGHPSGTAPGWVRSFRVDLRLGQRGTFPFDAVGPASVNLANGNLVVAASSATVPALAGPVGVSLVYNSLTPAQPGLIGTYTADTNGNHSVDSGETAAVVRRDPSITFDWGAGPPAPGLPATNVIAKWVGYVSMPAGSYKFGATTSDGVKITVGSTVVVDSWTTQAAGAPVYAAAVTLPGSPVPITVEWFKGATAGAVLKLYVKGDGSTALAEQLVEPSALSSEAGALPAGWTLAPLGGGLSYVRAVVSDSKVVLVGPDGDTHVYTSTGSGYSPPKDEDGILAQDSAGLLTLDASDGITYVFDAAGGLRSATSSSGAKPASLRYTWATPSGSQLPRLTGVTDPVSTRTVVLRYGGDGACPGSAPSGFDSAAPTGMLCSVELWDARTTKLWYVGGRLARIENPDAEVTDFAYGTNGRISKVRDPFAADLVAAGQRDDDDTTRTLIAYDGSGRVSSVTLGEPTAGAPRPGHSYDYVSSTEVQVDVADLTEPPGRARRRVTMDVAGRQLSDTDATNRTTSYVWDAADRVVATTDPAGLRSTTIFDWAGRPVEAYGPAPAAWFGTDNKPLAGYVSRVAKTTTGYDEGMVGLDALYFDNASFAGEPVGHQLGVGDTSGALHAAWASTPPGVTGSAWSVRLTGEVTMEYAGTYTFTPNVVGRARIYLDDVLLLDTSSAPTATYSNTSVKHRVRVEYTNVGPSWHTYAYTGSAQSVTVPAGVTAVKVQAWGAQGGASMGGDAYWGSAAGTGGYAEATVPVTAGESLQVNVGGKGGDGSGSAGGGHGGFNGGGDAGSSTAGGGGGASDVRRGGTGVADRVVVAGGGGGGGFGIRSGYGGTYGQSGGGGNGGATAGGAGQLGMPCCGANGGSGGAAAGAGGAGGSGHDTQGQAGTAGSSGPGGAGGSGMTPGGGGGGGDVGGGGGGGGGGYWTYEVQYAGGAGGGGGGSNHVSGTATTSSAGGRTGDGQVLLGMIGPWSPATFDLHWSEPGGDDVRVPGTALAPRYGLVTSTVDPDGRKVATEYRDTTVTPAVDPALGLATATVADPAGLALRSTATFEPTGTGFYRQTSRALPKAVASGVASARVTYGYYGATETRTNPCPGGTSAIQAGFAKLTTEADPDGAGSQVPIQREVVYDGAGRTVASRVVSDGAAWSCTTYDPRGRAATSTDRAGRTTTFDRSMPGTLTTTSPDSAGTSRSTVTVVDLLGRPTRYTDELGTATRYAYDQVGRVTGTYRTFAGGSETQVTAASYDAAGRVSTLTDDVSGTPRTTSYAYDAAGRVASQTRPNGVVTTTSYSSETGRVGAVSHDVASTTTTHTASFPSLGAPQTWVVPAGVTSVTVEAWGGQGGRSTMSGEVGALGGYAKGTIAVTPGETLTLVVGSAGSDAHTSGAGSPGGYDGGGASGFLGGGGGGASDLRRGGTALGDRVLVAGGGGGAGRYAFPGYGRGGAGGGATGAPGLQASPPPSMAATYGYSGGGGGGGGTPSGGGAAGTGGTSGSAVAAAGAAGTFGVGAGGGTSSGGGGGGGWYGGGSGGAGGGDGLDGGGGGGSNLVTGTNTTSSQGVWSGPGQMVLTWTTSTAPSASYLYTLGGRISRETLGGTTVRQRDHSYDGAGRLTTTVEGSATRRYAYDADTNRCGLAAGCESAWSYDAADRITASPYASSYTYDAHGNVIAMASVGGLQSQGFAYTGAAQGFTVPSGVSSLTAEVSGAAGGAAAGAGGRGGRVTATFAVTPGESLQVNVGGAGATPASSSATGGAGGWNGGGAGGVEVIGVGAAGGGGGGGSDVRRGGTALATRKVVAGGGGGSGGAVYNSVHTLPDGGGVGTGTAAGGAGAPGYGGYGDGQDGTLGVGGAGGGSTAYTSASGGGGGGGYYGGGGGSGKGGYGNYNGGGGGHGGVTADNNWGAGGGGGGYADPAATDVSSIVGAQTGNGQVTLSWHTPVSAAAITYDALDHATVVDDGVTRITETLAPTGRVLRRVVTTIATSTVTEDTSYGYSGDGDSPAYSRPTAGGTVTTYLPSIGGLVDVGGTATWSLYNTHGDVLGTTNAAGTYTAAPVADEFGIGTTPASRLGWLGQQQRPSVGGTVGVMRMGVRLYDPRLGRFLEVDPVAGGSANDYDYCGGDPVNCFDLAGTMKTPERNSATNTFFAYLAQHPEVAAYLASLSKNQYQPPAPAQPQPSPSTGLNPNRGPDPSRAGGDGGRRGPDPCQCPAPTGPRSGNLPSLSARDAVATGVGITVSIVVGVPCEVSSLGLGSVGCAALGGAAGAGADWLTRRLW